jgi:hypothetical protein
MNLIQDDKIFMRTFQKGQTMKEAYPTGLAKKVPINMI